MGDPRDDVEELLAERPDIEGDIAAILSTDEELGTWTFDDVQIDSGTFGEIVSRGIVESIDGGYRVADYDAVSTAVDGAERDADDHDGLSIAVDSFRVGTLTNVLVEQLNSRSVRLLGAVFGLVAMFRLVPFTAIFREDNVVLSSNDPYYYRYLVEQVASRASGALDFATLSNLPSEAADGEPLLVVFLWFHSELLGGGLDSVGFVLAWYPVVAGLASALFVYALAKKVTLDRRVGLAAVGLLAVTPVHAFRTGLGFADHHAFDYVWLAMTALALVALVDRDVHEPKTWGWVGLFALGVTGQTLAWDAGPLLLIPIGLYVAGHVLMDVQNGNPPAERMATIVVGVTLGAFLVQLAHTRLGWHTDVVAATPVLLTVAVVFVVALGEVARRLGGTAVSLAAAAVVSGAGLVGVVFLALPTASSAFGQGIAYLLEPKAIAETRSLFKTDLGIVVAPIFLFGFVLFLGLPYLAWASWYAYREHHRRWLVPVVYGWYFLVLATLQVRFAGELSLFVAVFAGLGFVHLAAWVDLLPPPKPFRDDDSQASGIVDDRSTGPDANGTTSGRRDVLYVAGIGVGVGGLGALLTPFKHSQMTVEDSVYRTAQWMRTYADERGWRYPRNYVFSEWSRNRAYNYFVNGESKAYGFAFGNYADFLQSTESERWYRHLREMDRGGFVVVSEDEDVGFVDGSMYEHLVEGWGEKTSHYRVLWRDDTSGRKVYTLVPGATVTGPGNPGDTVSLTFDTEAGGTPLELERHVEVNEFGVYEATVPLAGVLSSGTDEFQITPKDVEEGSLISGFDGPGIAHWSFDEGDGGVAYDRVGGHHAEITGATWTDDGRDGHALSFEDESDRVVPTVGPPIVADREMTISVWFKTTSEDGFQRIVAKARSGPFRETRGYQLAVARGRIQAAAGNGEQAEVLRGPAVSDGEWHRAVLTWNEDNLELILDGERVSVATGPPVATIDDSFSIGSASDGNGTFDGLIDEVRVDSKYVERT